MIVKEINMLQKGFLSNFNWQSVKYLFGIMKKGFTTYLIFLFTKSYNNHFSNIVYDIIIMFKINSHNIKFKKKWPKY